MAGPLPPPLLGGRTTKKRTFFCGCPNLEDRGGRPHALVEGGILLPVPRLPRMVDLEEKLENIF